MFRSKYKVIRPFNHNVVLCLKDDKECILIGKGVGFGVKVGDKLKAPEAIEKEFFLVDSGNKENFNSLSNSIDRNIIGVTEEAIAMISRKLNKELNEKIHITLPDHIAFAVKRLESGIEIKNVLLHEIKFLYKEEFEVAEEFLNIVNKKLKVNLPKDEAGFIAMHLHAAINNEDVSKSSLDTAIITDMVNFIEKNISKEINKDSLEYCRLVTHLRFAIERVRSKTKIENILIDSIKTSYSETYNLSQKLANVVEEEYGIKFPEGEIGYITVHLENILKS